MENLQKYEDFFENFMKNFHKIPKDLIFNIDLSLMDGLGLLEDSRFSEDKKEFSQFFHAIESPEKITLINDMFVVWIVPQIVGETRSTMSVISRKVKEENTLHTEVVFFNQGIYNTSPLIIRLLDFFIKDIIDFNKIAR